MKTITELRRDPDRRPTHPGIFLREMLKGRSISQETFARAIGISTKHLSQIVTGKVRLTPEIAAHMGKALDVPVEFWLNAQAKVDAFDAREEARNWQPHIELPKTRVA